ARTAELRAEMAGPQAILPHDLLQRTGEFVARRIGHVPGVFDHAVDGGDFFVHEGLHPVQLLLELRVRFEIPCHVDRLLPCDEKFSSAIRSPIQRVRTVHALMPGAPYTWVNPTLGSPGTCLSPAAPRSWTTFS